MATRNGHYELYEPGELRIRFTTSSHYEPGLIWLISTMSCHKHRQSRYHGIQTWLLCPALWLASTIPWLPQDMSQHVRDTPSQAKCGNYEASRDRNAWKRWLSHSKLLTTWEVSNNFCMADSYSCTLSTINNEFLICSKGRMVYWYIPLSKTVG